MLLAIDCATFIPVHHEMYGNIKRLMHRIIRDRRQRKTTVITNHKATYS